jgi:PKD domain
MKKIIHLLILLILPLKMISQPNFDYKRDNSWVLGYNPDTFDLGEVVHEIFDFNSNDVIFNEIQHDGLPISSMNGTMSDENGQMLFYSNGCSIYSNNEEPVQGAVKINLGPLHESICDGGGYLAQQGMLILPLNKDKFLSAYINLGYLNNSLQVVKLLNLIVNKTSSNEFIAEGVDNMVETDSLYGNISACRHANGRDWWIINPENESNGYYIYHVNANGIITKQKQFIGVSTHFYELGSGQSVFTPDGTKFIRNTGWAGLQIFDFDRCDGTLSNPKHILIDTDSTWVLGAAVSPNNRFLYLPSLTKIYQLDLWADDIGASKTVVAEYDGYVEWGFLTIDFWMAQLAPDGRIYLGTGGRYAFHVIEHPDRQGVACDVRQRKYRLDWPISGVPNNPNYRLGPVDGSICDSLGYNNDPQANFRYERDTLDSLSLGFVDLSFHEPALWYWDFGDGSTSQDTTPIHTYAQAGIYTVCLVVENEYGRDSFCREINMGITIGVHDVNSLGFEINAFPNPVHHALTVSVANGDIPWGSQVCLFNAQGQLVLQQKMWTGTVTVEVGGLPKGLYFWRVSCSGSILGSGKVVKI